MIFHYIFRNGQLLLVKNSDGFYTIPQNDNSLIKSIEKTALKMNVEETDNILTMAYDLQEDIVLSSDEYEWCPLRDSFYKIPREMYDKAGKCQELLYWNKRNKYCGVCGKELVMSSNISKQCPHCGNEIWPLLSTAVIVLIEREDKALLVHARNFRKNFYGLVAGFVETGETLEEAVKREVREETSLEISDLRYFASQPWPYPCGLMVGFFAKYKSGEINLQEEELTDGGWFTRDELPTLPEKMSIARRLIESWRCRGGIKD